MRRLVPRIVRTSLTAGLLTMAAFPGHAQIPGRGPMLGWPYDPTLMPYGGYWNSPCYPFASCWTYQQFQIQERRRERFEELARGQQTPPQNRSGFPLTPRDGEAKTPTAANVQPAYVESGQVRDEYQQSGDFLPEFVNGTGRSRP
jgi:hypothetical protein